MANLPPPAEPPTELGRYRILSKRAGIRVSPLQLGGANIGQAWAGFGAMTKENAFKLLDAYEEAGGNFIDTANTYQDEESETWIGEWMAQKQNRDFMVIATKFTTGYTVYKHGPGGKSVNAAGNHSRSLYMSLRDSLKKLQTDWIDILYVHWWDWTTSIEEMMDSLDTVVKQGKVLYLGISDCPAYIVAAANTYAIQQGKTPFSIYQGKYNVMVRDLELEVFPMIRHFGMAFAPWEALGGGKFQTKKQIAARQQVNETLRPLFGAEQTEQEARMSAALEQVAQEHGLEDAPTTIALAYVLAKAPNVFPIVGGRKVEQLQANIKALSIRLTSAQMVFLESIVPFKPGFPQNLVGEDPRLSGKMIPLLSSVAPIAFVKE